jgi:NAD(P)-dependent dehydrogenase (short-subunit alcohol dehydrogenase family)
MKLDGATVLITGGAIRFGAYLCRAFARRGAKLIIHYRNSYADANALLQELGSGKDSNARQLLYALRPYLKKDRQDKVERALQLARLFRIGKKFLAEWEG